MTDPHADDETPLDKTFAELLARRRSNNRLRQLTLPDPGAVDFSSNGYLSLSAHPAIRQEYISRLGRTPPHFFSLGSCGSRLLDGNSPLAETLERDLAAFHGAPAALLFNSGFEANSGLFSCVSQPGDVVVYDELIHASVRDGIRLGRATGVAFAHNCIARADEPPGPASGLPSLEEVLRRLGNGADGRNRARNVFVAVEAVYSMDGDVAPLQGLVDCVEACLPDGNGYIIVDEAHSTGWMGKEGRGLVNHLGLQDKIWARLHTFGKAMGCSGAAVLCSPTTRSYLINYARSLIYTTAMGFPALAAIQTTYDYLAAGRAATLLENLAARMTQTHQLLAALLRKHDPPPRLFRVNASPPASPIIPLFSARARSLARYCQQRGYMVRPIVAPTVPTGTDRVRLCIHAANTAAEVQGLCLAIEEWLLHQLDGDASADMAAGCEMPQGRASAAPAIMVEEAQANVRSKL